MHSTSTLTDQLVLEINQKMARGGHGWQIVLVAAPLLIVGVISTPYAIVIVPTVALLAYIYINNYDQGQRVSSINYHLTSQDAGHFAELNELLRQFSTISGLWFIKPPASDTVRPPNILKHSIKLECKSPRFIITNQTPYCLTHDKLQVYFFPDRILIFSAGAYRVSDYAVVSISHRVIKCVDRGVLPSDAVIVNRGWIYQNKDGSPDTRYKNNLQVPTVRYGMITLRVTYDLVLYLIASDATRSKQFVSGFNQLLSNTKHCGNRVGSNAHRSSTIPKSTYNHRRQNLSGDAYHDDQCAENNYRKQRAATDDSYNNQWSRAKKAKTIKNKHKSAYDILGVGTDVTHQQLLAAYRQKAQIYHPDKVILLAPKYRALAEREMKKINAAYDELKKRV